MSQILVNLKSARQLRDLYIGVDDTLSPRPTPVVGLNRAARSLGMTMDDAMHCEYVLNHRKNLRFNDTGALHLAGRNSVLYRALEQSGFRRRIVHLKLQNLSNQGCTWSLMRVWAGFDHPSFKEISVLDRAHVWSGAAEEEPPVLLIEELCLGGCHSSKACEVDDATFVLLRNTAFPQLARLELQHYSISDVDFISLIKHFRHTVRSINLVTMHLLSGNVLAAFGAFQLCPELEELRVSLFSEMRTPADMHITNMKEGRPAWLMSMETLNKEELQTELASLFRQYVHLKIYDEPDEEYGRRYVGFAAPAVAREETAMSGHY